MKPDPNHRRTWHATGFAAGLLLTTGLVLTSGCGSDTPKPSPVVTPTPAVDATSSNAKAKGKGKPGYEAYDDLRERRAKRRAAQGQG